MDRLNNDAITLGLQFMEVPLDQRADALREALTMFHRRRHAGGATPLDDAEGD
jgi:hypothetical protein